MLLCLVRASDGSADVAGGDLSRVGAMIEGPAFYPALCRSIARCQDADDDGPGDDDGPNDN